MVVWGATGCDRTLAVSLACPFYVFCPASCRCKDDDRDRPYEAFATFQFFLFAVYSTFFVALSVSAFHLISYFELGMPRNPSLLCVPGLWRVLAPATSNNNTNNNTNN